MNEFHIARCALCAKANIPEVEAVIALLDPFVQQELRQIAAQVYRELLARLDAFSDDLGAADVDALVRAGENRDEVLAAILVGLLAAVEQGYGAFVSADLRERVENAIDELFAFAVREVGFPFAGSQAEVLRQAALGQLDALLRETVVGRSAELRQLLETFLTTAGPRAAEAGVLSAAAGDSGMSREQFQVDLASILTPAAAAAATVDAWAYLWQNVAAVEASIDGGIRAFEAIAVGGKLGDGRTTRFCRWVHGRLIPMSRVRPQLDRIRQSGLEGRAAAIQAAWPFLDPDIARNGNELQFEMFFRGVGLPPYHFGCRTKVRPIRIGR